MTRLRQATSLLQAVARTLHWAALPAVLVLALGLVELQRRQPDQQDLRALRAGALLLALWAGFALDDPAEATVAPTPFPLLGRRALRVLAALAALGAGWALLVARTPGPLPVGGLTLEAAALVTVALAAAGVASRVAADRLGGPVAGPAVLAFTLGAIRLPGRLRLFAGPGDPGWAAAHGRWAAVLAAAVLVLLAASLDPTLPISKRLGMGLPHRLHRRSRLPVTTVTSKK